MSEFKLTYDAGYEWGNHMTPTEFCYWLQGYFELTLIDYQGVELSEGQVEEIHKHLKMVFNQESETPRSC